METQEVYQLIQQAQSGKQQAKEKLISENTGLIWSIVKRFQGRGYDLEDLYQIGAIGLLKCIEKFDVTMNLKFSTYAVPMIMGEIKRFLRDDGMIKITSLSFYATQTKHRNYIIVFPSSIQTILSVMELHHISKYLFARGLYRRSGITPCPEENHI